MSKEMSMFDVIKKQNGESFAKTIRNYDCGIFEIPDIDKIVKHAGRDAEPIINYLVSLKNVQINEKASYQNPFELLYKAGYNAEYADTLQKQNSIEKYFKPDEKLCTFHDKNRFKNYYIINAVKTNVDEIKRENFTDPQREDSYGTSVISIQILKYGGFISIKNRYNHTVINPDNTYNSNPDNIIDGLSMALKRYFNVDFSSHKTPLPPYYTLINNQIIKYNYEENNIYWGNDFFATDNKIYEIDKNSQIILDYFLFDLKQKKILTSYKGINLHTKDSFISAFNEEIRNAKIQIRKHSNKEYIILSDNIPVIQINDGYITAISLHKTHEIGNFFLHQNNSILNIDLPNIEKIGSDFLYENKNLEQVSLPRVKEIGDSFLYTNRKLSNLYLPNVKHISSEFLCYNKSLTRISLPNVTKIGDSFLYSNTAISFVNLPNVKNIDSDFLYNNNTLNDLSLPQVKTIGENFLHHNDTLFNICLPNAEKICSNFLFSNNKLNEISLPNVKMIEDNFLNKNEIISIIDLPKLEKIGSSFLFCNNNLKKLSLPNVKTINSDFLYKNKIISDIDLPETKSIESSFLYNNEEVEKIFLPNLKKLGNDFLYMNQKLYYLYAPKIHLSKIRSDNIKILKDAYILAIKKTKINAIKTK